MFQFDHNEVPFGCPPSQPPPPPPRIIKPVPNVIHNDIEDEDVEDEEVVHETLPLTILLKKALKLVNKKYSLK